MRPTLGDRARQILPYVVIVIMALAIVWLPMTHQVYISGADTAYHMNSTYDTAQQIKTGHFSYFLTTFGFGRSARIVNALYGPLGDYLSGLILLIAGTWLRWEITIELVVLITAGCAMYYLARNWQVARVVSTLVSLLYMLSTPLMEFMWGQQYDGVGAALIPVVILFGSQMLKRGRFNWIGLAITMTLLAEVHLFSVVLGALALVPCFIMALIEHYRGGIRLVGQVIKALGLTLLLTLNVWGAIIEVLGSNQSLIPIYPNDNFSANSNGAISYVAGAHPSQNPSILGLAVTVLLALILVMYVLDCRHLDAALNMMTIVLGAGSLWMATRWFPWAGLQAKYPSLNINVQFPRRFLPVSFTVLLLTLAVIVDRMRLPIRKLVLPKPYIIAVAVLALFVGHLLITNDRSAQINQQRYHSKAVMMFSVGMYWRTNPNPARLRRILTGPHYGRFIQTIVKPTPDYMPSSKPIQPTDASYLRWHPYALNINQIYQYHGPVSYHYLPHHAFQVDFDRSRGGQVTLPLVKYAHTAVWLNGRRVVDPRISPVGAMRVKLHRGTNRVRLQYQPAAWFKLGILVSIVSWLGLLCWPFRRRFKNKLN